MMSVYHFLKIPEANYFLVSCILISEPVYFAFKIIKLFSSLNVLICQAGKLSRSLLFFEI
ncbi:MAG: hypothetical protein A2W85_02435 [Bacteroidetes bacterium GWF2_41_31]|nr:MAG: hypothetical protein A2W85_02435 [Bacteroidetes bacterium GWF2_41_31]